MVFFNTHLDNDGETARKKEGVQLILNKIKEIAPHMPAIITGDFNCTPDETPLQTLEKGGMENASKWQPLRTVHPGLSMISVGCRWKNVSCWIMCL